MSAAGNNNRQCQNCGQSVLATDTVCWHCGQTLADRPQLVLPDTGRKPVATSQATDEEGARPEYNLRALAIYGLVTGAVILALLLVMVSLGRRPLLVRGAGLTFASDWITVTDSQLQYTLSFPPGWQWLDVPHREQQATLADLISRQGYIDRALSPLSGLVEDPEIVAVALNSATFQEAEPLPFVVIGRDPAMASTTPEQVIAWLEGQDLTVTELEVDTHVPTQPQARYDLLDDRFDYHCRHLFSADESAAGYLLAACAPQDQFGIIMRDLEQILNSFQLLQQ